MRGNGSGCFGAVVVLLFLAFLALVCAGQILAALVEMAGGR
jgi:hypothetical protein